MPGPTAVARRSPTPIRAAVPKLQRCAAACLLGLAFLTAGPLRAADPLKPADFDALSQRLDRQDAHAPQALEMHLRYADFLAKSAEENCEVPLATAQAQWDLVHANAALGVVLPSGLAREAHILYEIHAARAGCAQDGDRAPEWQAALAAAERAVELYREDYDYVSMATMQYNVALCWHALGDEARAVAELKRLIEMDREFGFREDAAENYPLLLQWQHQDASEAQVAARMRDFPARSATLKFAWAGGDERRILTSDYAQLIGEQLLHAHAVRTLARQVRQHAAGWVVSYQPLSASYTLDELPPVPGAAAGFMRSLADFLVQCPDVAINDLAFGQSGGRGAEFYKRLDSVSFAARVQADAESLLKGLDEDARRAPALAPILKTALHAEFTVLSTASAVDFNLEAGAWPEAVLEQGVWYQMTLPLPLAFAPALSVEQSVEFAYSRDVPCNGESSASCIEIVLRAAPEEVSFHTLLQSLERRAHLPKGHALQAFSATSIRLVTDPLTLTAQAREIRQHGYLSGGNSDEAIVSEARLLTRSEAVLTPH